MRRLLSYEYLLEPIPGQPGALRLLYWILALGTCVGLLVAARWRRDPAARFQSAALAEFILGLCALVLVACSFAGVPILSMRILVFGSNALAWLLPVMFWVGQHEAADTWQRHRRALLGQLDMVEQLLPPYSSLLLLGAHVLGLLVTSAHYDWPLWSPLLWSAGLLSPQLLFSLRAQRWKVHLEALAPLFGLYAVLALRLLVLLVAKALGDPHFFLPTAWDRLLNVDWALLAAASWAIMAQVYAILRHHGRAGALLSGVAALWLLASCAWAGYTYIRLRTHGVTGTDPYGYAQMAVDLYERGVLVHAFPLVARMEQLGVFSEAGVHLGYHLPYDESGRAATVWPFGQSILLAAGYRLAREEGLYFVTPLLGLLSLVALVALTWQLLADRSLEERTVTSAVAVFVLATSYAQVERLVVPMADAAAQLFTTLTLVLWLGAMRCVGHPESRRSAWLRLWAILAGLSLGVAYLVRHTQLVLWAGVLFVAWAARGKLRHKVTALVCLATAALLLAIPDLLYHQQVMGHWLRPESLELRHFGWGFMWPMAVRMLRGLLTSNEFLYLSPFVLFGLWRQAREDGLRFAALATVLLAVVLIHLPYEALRLRDLLSIFPMLCFWAGYGVASVWRRIRDAQHCPVTPPFLRALGYSFVLALLLLLRTRTTLGLARASDFDAFGYLNASQRAAFAQIGRDTEPLALIGASLNSGAVELHGLRTAFRPAVWRSDEFCTFVDDAVTRGAPLYLLEDGLEMAGPLAAARQRYQLEFVGRYDIPFYHTGGGSVGGRVPLYRVEPGAD